MSSTIIKGIDGFERYLKDLPDIASRAASLAINQVTAGTGLTLLRNEIYKEIDFPRGYLDNDKLGVQKRASPSNLEASIVGRDRPTSLARFVKNAPTSRKGGLSVTVKPGNPKTMSNAWLVKLNNGNMGLAIRLKPGERLANKRKNASVQLSPNVYLLYGPSVNQVLSGVADDHLDEIGDLVSKEFLRQMTRLTNG